MSEIGDSRQECNGESCERENTPNIHSFIEEHLLNQMPAEAKRLTKSVKVFLNCGGIAMEGSGCKSECVPFVVVQLYGDEERKLGEVTYIGNCTPPRDRKLL
jgi:hypothetical protein